MMHNMCERLDHILNLVWLVHERLPGWIGWATGLQEDCGHRTSPPAAIGEARAHARIELR